MLPIGSLGLSFGKSDTDASTPISSAGGSTFGPLTVGGGAVNRIPPWLWLAAAAVAVVVLLRKL